MSKKKVTTLIVQFENSVFDPKVDKFLKKVDKLIGKNEDIIVNGAGKVFPNLKSLEDSVERHFSNDEVLKFKWVKPSKKNFTGKVSKEVKDLLAKAKESIGTISPVSLATNSKPYTVSIIPTLADVAKKVKCVEWPENEEECNYCNHYDAFIEVLGEENFDLVEKALNAGFTSEVLEGWDKQKAVTVFRILNKLGKLD